jgi:uncharacterized coiled-coil protein SlyX
MSAEQLATLKQLQAALAASPSTVEQLQVLMRRLVAA